LRSRRPSKSTPLMRVLRAKGTKWRAQLVDVARSRSRTVLLREHD
jgi:hypothetical protein